MEEYVTGSTAVSAIKQGQYCKAVRAKHESSYGTKGADNIQTNSVRIYASLMQQLATSRNHNSLLVGKVQSGKTSNLELLTALAFDNGYNFLVILGGYDKDLVKQTSDRYGETFDTKGGDDGLISDSPVLFTTNEIHDEAKSYFIADLNAEFVQECIDDGRPIVVSCLKRVNKMQLVNKLIKRVCQEVMGIKPFIIDDEGDQASLNTKKKSASPTYAEIQKMKKNLGNPLYLSVTATPQANIFQSIYSDLIPESIHLIHPGSGYDGATVFHLAENRIIEPISVDDATDTCAGLLTKSLKDALNYFIVGSVLKGLSATSSKGRFSEMIIHSAKEVALHQKLFDVIYNHIDQMKLSFANKDDSYQTYLNEFRTIYDRFVDEGYKAKYPFDPMLVSALPKEIKKTGAILHNGPGKKKSASTNFAHRIYIGADLLQRGLTFKNLITTYFVRWASSGGNMDTNLQRARWFGYREEYIPLCKMFTTPEIAKEYSNLADIEDDLWEQFTDVEEGKKIIQDIIISSENTKQKPTSKNKANYKEVRFKNRWVKQRFIVSDEETIASNNQTIGHIIENHNWENTFNGSRNNEVTGRFSILKGAQLVSLIDSIAEAFDMEPFEKNAVKDLIGQDNIPVILMWKDGDPKRYRSLYRDQPNRIKALQQGANTTVEENITYEGDSKVIVDPETINIQIYDISPGLSKNERTNQDQYMFAIYIPKGKTYYVKAYEDH